MTQLYLASQSPRRRELLSKLGVSFETFSVDLDETVLPNEEAHPYVERLALAKAQAGYDRLPIEQQKKAVVLGSDTTVAIDEHILGKPESFETFHAMMQRLSGKAHQVMTGVALVSAQQKEAIVVTANVEFADLSDELIAEYWATGEPQDKAGGYGIQGLGAVLVTGLQGSHSAVVGLPLRETAQLLGRFNIPIWQGAHLLR